jgi:Mn-dependent DtxR family transcriptional regulator
MDDSYYTFSEYMKKSGRLSANEEDYLEMVYRLCLSGGYTRVNDLASALNVKPPSASSMLKRLVEKNLLVHVGYGTIELTEDGKIIGQLLFERHQTVERFMKLLDVRTNILEEVEKIEHTLSNETLYLIKKLVTFIESDNEILRKYRQYKQKN